MAAKKNRMTVEGWKRSRLTARGVEFGLLSLSMSHGDNTNLTAASHFVGMLLGEIENTIVQLEKAPALPADPAE